jgi:hypothetical protein
VKEVSEAFKKCFTAKLEGARKKGDIKWQSKGSDDTSFNELVNKAAEKPWVVYLQPPVARPEDVIDYLGRYAHRIAFGNHRLTKIADEEVVFAWYDRDTRETKEQTLEPEEFMERYLQHVVPVNFYRIRHYGLYANRNRKRLLRQAMLALGYFPEIEKPEPKTPEQWLTIMTGEDITLCPQCKEGKLHRMPFPPCKSFPR